MLWALLAGPHMSLVAYVVNSKVTMTHVCCSLDKGLLRGGLREGHHTEVAGESGSGKTQLCMQVRRTCHM